MTDALPVETAQSNPVTRYLYALVATMVLVGVFIIAAIQYQGKTLAQKTDKINNYHMFSFAQALAIREILGRTELRLLRKSVFQNSSSSRGIVKDDVYNVNIIENMFVELLQHNGELVHAQTLYSDMEFALLTQQLDAQIRQFYAQINKTTFSDKQAAQFVENELKTVYIKAHQLERLHEKKILASRLEMNTEYGRKNVQAMTFIGVAMMIGAFFTLHLFKNIKLLFEKQRWAEAGIRRLNADLEERVSQRTVELQAANNHLQSSLQQLHETQAQLVQSEKMASLGGLVSGVAHEINTPVGVGITAISHLQLKLEQYASRYQSGQLTREDFESLLATAAESSQIIHNNLNRAGDLVRSFKQVAVDQASNERRRFNLRTYLQEILQNLSPKLKSGDYQVLLECPEDLNLYTHPGALSQVITNLVMNSLIHGFANRARGNIRIAVSAGDSGYVRLEYRDDGCGIAAENDRKIFEPFFTTRRGQGGTGLGMHIVFNLVTQTLGGKIQYQRMGDEGVCFGLELPVEQEETTVLSDKKYLAS